MKTRYLIIGLVLVIASAGGGFWWWQVRPARASNQPSLELTGVIEARRVYLAAEIGGQVQAVLVEEGQQVSAGQVLARIDTTLLEAQLAQARATVATAEANLAQVKAGARPEEIAAAQAAADQARALRDGAAKGYENALKILKNPQELDALVVQARGNRDTVQRMLAEVRAGARPQDIAAARAALNQAEANLQTTRDQLSAAKTQAEAQVRQAAEALIQAQTRYAQARDNWTYVQETGKDPAGVSVDVASQQAGNVSVTSDDLSEAARANYYAQFVQAESALRQAEQAVAQAQVAAETAHQAEITGIQTVEAQTQQTAATFDKIRSGATKEQLATAETALRNAQAALDVALEMQANPQQLQAAADAAQTQLAAAEAQLAQAQAQLELLQAGARPEQIRAAEAQLAQARAVQQQIEVQIAKATITASQNGVVLARSTEPGQITAPGATLLELGRLDRLELKVYVPEEQFGTMTQGETVKVQSDAYPGRIFTGTVLRLADQAEFTPTNVQTKEDRTRLVYALVIGLDNPDLALKPGMFAEVAFGQ